MQNDYFPQPPKVFTLSVVQTSIWAFFIAMGVFMKIMHWPGHGLTTLVSTGGMLGYSLLALLLLRGRDLLNIALTTAGVIWLGYLVWGYVARGGYPYNEKGIYLNLGAMIITCGINAIVYRKYIARMN